MCHALQQGVVDPGLRGQSGGQHRGEDRQRDAAHECREHEQRRHFGFIPERARFEHTVHRAQRGLVEHRKAQACNGEIRSIVVNVFHLRRDLREALSQPFQLGEDGHGLQHKHDQVEHHAHGHFPQQGVRVPVDQRMPETIRAADVEHEREHGHRVADQADESGGTRDRFVAFQAGQVDRRAQAERARAQRDGRQVNRNPQTPRHQVGQVGDGQAFPEDQDAARQSDGEQEAEGA